MALRGAKPEEKQKRLKMFVYGAAGVGKTVASIQFPKSYIIDTERGTDAYTAMINRAGSLVFQSSNFDDVVKEVKELLTVQHEFRTIIVDPITQLYNAVQEKWTRIFEKHARTEKEAEIQDFGMRFWGRVKSDFKSLQRMLVSIDTNVIVTSHQKDLYGAGMQKMGVTFDSMKGEDYLYDLVFRLENKNGKRMATTVKERAEPNKNKFPPEFEWSYENFKKFYGGDVMERAASPVSLASPEQLAKLRALLEVVKVEQTEIDKWFTKADVESWDEMTGDTVEKVIAHLENKLSALKKTGVGEAK
jgi:GTPase SAR1 family protein